MAKRTKRRRHDENNKNESSRKQQQVVFEPSEESHSTTTTTTSNNSSSGTGLLLSSIFGDTAAAAAAAAAAAKQETGLLFSNASKWKSTTRELVQKNLSKQQQQQQVQDATAKTAKRKLSRNEILKQRQELSQSDASKKKLLVESITVQIKDYQLNYFETNHQSTLKKDENNNETRLFAKRCAHLVRNKGVLIIETGEKDEENVNLFPSHLLQQVATKANEIKQDVCKRLEQMGQTKWREEEKSQNEDASFRYVEVASRCRGRLDVRYQTDQSPFTDLLVQNNNRYLWSMIYELLGRDAKLVYTGLIYSFPNSADQPWHQDGTALFDADELDVDLPPYALNVFVPLSDITEELGPTEFLVGSHFLEKTEEIQERLQEQNDVDLQEDDETMVGPLLKFGSALIYDCRICHRGTSNLSSESTRPMLYMIYARPWFQEHLNFGSDHLF